MNKVEKPLELFQVKYVKNDLTLDRCIEYTINGEAEITINWYKVDGSIRILIDSPEERGLELLGALLG